jgi:hypothetical protein
MLRIGLLWLWIGCSVGVLEASGRADSIMMEVLRMRDLYGGYVREYEAEVYIKGHTEVVRKNWLSRYAPDFLYWTGKGGEAFTEAVVDVHYEAPNHFTQQIRAINGDLPMANDIQGRLMQFLNINIYNPTIFDDRVILPDVRNIFKYYRFEYVGVMDTLGRKVHQIGVHPRTRSQRLIGGDFYITDGEWTIFRVDVRGKWELFDFRIETQFGLTGADFLLPVHSAVTFHMKLFGNEAESRYFSQFDYRSVKLYDSDSRRERFHYDLSNYFNVKTDSIPFVRDSAFWAAERPIPLSEDEQELWEARRAGAAAGDSTVVRSTAWSSFSKGFVVPKSFVYNDMQFSYSGLMNPLKLAYTKLDGLLYWQQFRLRRDFQNGHGFRFQPNLGILFQRKQVYFDAPVAWTFAPERFGELTFRIGNRNRSYNSTIIRQIDSAVADSIRFSDLNLDYYQHFKSELEARYELCNGLLLSAKINYDWYIPVRKKGEDMPPPPANDGDVIDLVKNRYRIFAPAIGLRWTPGQFYRIDGKRKEYLYSHYPTFFVEYARGLRGVLQSNSHYERIELDVQQKIRLGLKRSFHYYAGAGRFTNTRSVYFADFDHFQRRNIPQSWRDPLGGVFHLLENDWYNAADAYVQLHLMYESPFTILRLFRHLSSDIVNERIYASQLYTPARPCYTEIGYGIGNFIGNAGVFVSFNWGKYEAVGARFAFELGI